MTHRKRPWGAVPLAAAAAIAVAVGLALVVWRPDWRIVRPTLTPAPTADQAPLGDQTLADAPMDSGATRAEDDPPARPSALPTGAGLFLAAPPDAGGAAPPPEVQARLEAARAEPSVVAVRAVWLRQDLRLEDLPTLSPPPAFNPFPESPHAVTAWTLEDGPFGPTLKGILSDTADTLVVTAESGHLSGRVFVAGHMLSVDPLGGGWHLATRRDPDRLPREGAPAEAHPID